ncbi:MAG: hypothetical protein SFV21_00195 [Rhodospirillaceae bacterium]|nr:hypothetical protein [Rhodospirillaceae bacterium]
MIDLTALLNGIGTFLAKVLTLFLVRKGGADAATVKQHEAADDAVRMADDARERVARDAGAAERLRDAFTRR